MGGYEYFVWGKFYRRSGKLIIQEHSIVWFGRSFDEIL